MHNCDAALIRYPEELFTSLRLQLMMMRTEILNAEQECSGLVPQDMADIFSALCMLDNAVIEAQKSREYSDDMTIRELAKLAREKRRS